MCVIDIVNISRIHKCSPHAQVKARKSLLRSVAALWLVIAVCVCVSVTFVSCSTKKNTANTRRWQAFVTRFNVYYNGHEAYVLGMQDKANGNKDDYTKMLPVFMVGNKNSASLGKGNFEKAVTKSEKAIQLHSIKAKPEVSANKKRTPELKAWMARKEYNPYLKHAWLMMGRAQFEKGDFFEAAATFSYIIRHYAPEPDVVLEARIWLARCYAAEDWLYDAEDVMNRVRRDTVGVRVSSSLKYEADATQADLLLRQGHFEEAVPYMERVAKKTKGHKPKARRYFLLGQLHHTIGNDKAAYKSLQKCLSLSPSYETQFNARILQTEVVTGSDKSSAKKMIGKLKKMARNDNNKDYLDQVYYAMGNIHMALGDTVAAIESYEMGRKKATRSGIEKGTLLLRLGEVYWERRDFDKAQPCYSECVSLINKEHESYNEVKRRSKVLDQLVPFTSAIHMQDSLQWLTTCSVEERNAAIDRTIETLKQKEAEAKKARKDSAAQARAEENGSRGMADAESKSPRSNTMQMNNGDKSWYFYNVQLISQGKQDFKKKWGNRKNEDDWRRANKTVVAMDVEGYDYEAEERLEALKDSLATAGLSEDSIASYLQQNGYVAAEEVAKEEADTTQLDPHTREYYLEQLPFTAEAKAASDEIITESLCKAGEIEKDQLGDFPLAEETLLRLVEKYPECKEREDGLYQLFLLYSRWEKPDKVAYYRGLLAAEFPESPRTKMITDPEWETLARNGVQMEDSLYTATYKAYRNRQVEIVNDNFEESTERFPQGANRPKFIFIHCLNNLALESSDSIISELRGLLKDYPKSDVSEMAGMIVNGLESGRTIGDGTFDIGSLWSLRSLVAEEGSAAALKGREFTAETQTPFVFLMAYPTDSVNNDQLLYDVAHFNFTTFMSRGFDMAFDKQKRVTQLRISGFYNFDEVHTYAQRFFKDKHLQKVLENSRVVIISEENLQLLGTIFSYDDYKKFYDENFTVLDLTESKAGTLEQQITTRYEDEVEKPKKVSEEGDEDTLPEEEELLPEDEGEALGESGDDVHTEGSEETVGEEAVTNPVEQEEMLPEGDDNTTTSSAEETLPEEQETTVESGVEETIGGAEETNVVTSAEETLPIEEENRRVLNENPVGFEDKTGGLLNAQDEDVVDEGEMVGGNDEEVVADDTENVTSNNEEVIADDGEELPRKVDEEVVE